MSLVEDVVVRVTFKDDSTLDLTAENYLHKFSLMLELDTSRQALTGGVSANELNLVLNNSSGVFSLTNQESPYYGLIEEDIKLEVFVAGEPQGVFYVKNWDAPSTATRKVATIRAVDRLQSVLNSPVSLLPVNRYIMLKDYLKLVFLSVGFSEEDLDISEDLTEVLNYTVVSGASLSSVLNDIALSGHCYIYVGKDNKIHAVSKDIRGEVRHSFSDSVGIVSINPAKSLLSGGNTLSVGYYTTSLGEVTEVLAIKGVTLPVGESTLANYEVKNANLFEIDSVKLTSDKNVRLLGVTWTQSTVSITVENAEEEESTCDIFVYGRQLDLSSSYVLRQDYDLVQRNGRKDIKLESTLLQTKSSADALADKLWSLVTQPIPYIDAKLFINHFSLDLCEVVKFESERLNLNYTGYIHSLTFEWRGGDAVTVNVGVKPLLVDE